jgi:rod shape-determining protein MreB
MRSHKRKRRGLDLGIDLGTANTLAVSSNSGVLFSEPSICCFRAYDGVPTFVAAGTAAHSYVGKVARPLKIIRPLRNGVLSEMTAARELLRFVQRSIPRKMRFARLRPLIGFPADATEAEKRALTTAAMDAGFAEPELLPEPLLAAIGLGLDVDAPRGRMIVDCGAGTTDVAVISLGSICVSQTVRGGGEALDQALADHLHFRHRFHIGTASAEALKLQLAAALASEDRSTMLEVRGLDSASGLPRVLQLAITELEPIWQRHVDQIIRIIGGALRDTPPELCRDILEDGIALTGGGALDVSLGHRIEATTGIRTQVAPSPLRAVIEGLERTLVQ